jgi:O-antigen ligase
MPLKFIPIEHLHLQTAVIFLFLAMVVRTEFGRASEPDYDVLSGSAPLRLLPFLFLFMAMAFTSLLSGVTPFLGLELAIGITLSMFHPANALCFMVLLMILRPWEIGPPNQFLGYIPRFGVTLVVFSWLIHPRQHTLPSPRSRRAIIFLLGFSAWLAFTLLKSPSITQGIMDYLDAFVKPLLIFGMALFLIESERSVREFQSTLVIASLSLMSAGAYQFFSSGLTAGRLMSSGVLGDPNDMGAFIVMAMPFALVPAFDKKSGPFRKLAAFLYACLAAFVIWLTRSRGTMLAIAAQFLVSRLVRNKTSRVGILFTAGLLAVGYTGLLRIVPRDSGEMEASQDSRITFWKSAVNMAAHNPLLGVGFHQYPENYMSYAVGTVYERGNRTAHSSWFLALGESGVVGFTLFVGFFVSVVRVAWAERTYRPAQLYAVAGYGVAMSFLSHTYSQYFYILMALVLASAGVKDRRTSAT